jgi:hypothetical protein
LRAAVGTDDQQYMSSRECPMATNAEHVIRVLKVSMS